MNINEVINTKKEDKVFYVWKRHLPILNFFSQLPSGVFKYSGMGVMTGFDWNSLESYIRLQKIPEFLVRRIVMYAPIFEIEWSKYAQEQTKKRK